MSISTPAQTRTRLARLRARLGHSHSKAWNSANPEKRRAQKSVECALVAGALVREPCLRCGAEKAHAHHDDYSMPLDVVWLCPRHHKERHRELAEGSALTSPARESSRTDSPGASASGSSGNCEFVIVR
jgi:hypothetical protein